MVPGLTPGQVLPIYVHVTMRPEKSDRSLQIKLKGGQFRTEDRRIVLEDLTVGDGTPADLGGYVWEPVDVPVRATFRGYKADNLAHNAALEQFKKSCVVTVTAMTGDAKEITDALEWTSMTPAKEAGGTCRLTGHVMYTPEALGRLALELTVEAPSVRGATGPSSQRAYVHVLAKEPRLAIAVSRLKPGGEEPIFDSRNWIKGQDAGTPLATRLSTRLAVGRSGHGFGRHRAVTAVEGHPAAAAATRSDGELGDRVLRYRRADAEPSAGPRGPDRGKRSICSGDRGAGPAVPAPYGVCSNTDHRLDPAA